MPGCHCLSNVLTMTGSFTQQNHIVVYCDLCFLTVPFTILAAVMLSRCTDVGDCPWPMSKFTTKCSIFPSLMFKKSVPTSISVTKQTCAGYHMKQKCCDSFGCSHLSLGHPPLKNIQLGCSLRLVLIYIMYLNECWVSLLRSELGPWRLIELRDNPRVELTCQ